MTDKEKVEALLTELGVEYSHDGTDIMCECGDTKVDGYNGFFTLFEFDAEGKFVQMGAWE